MALAVELRPPLSFGREASALTLDELLGEARDSFAAELWIPLTVERPPQLYSIDADGQRTYEAAEGAQIGLSMSAQMYRRIGHPADQYGNVFPVARALHDLAGWCRGRHLEGRTGPWDDHVADVAIYAIERPLCARLAYHSVVWHMSPLWSAHQESLPLPVVRRLLAAALRHTWEQRREWAHVESGAAEIMAQQRSASREARARAEASRVTAILCRYCRVPYDPASTQPCPGTPEHRLSDEERAAFTAAFPGAALLCTPDMDG